MLLRGCAILFQSEQEFVQQVNVLGANEDPIKIEWMTNLGPGEIDVTLLILQHGGRRVIDDLDDFRCTGELIIRTTGWAGMQHDAVMDRGGKANSTFTTPLADEFARVANACPIQHPDVVPNIVGDLIPLVAGELAYRG